MTPLYTAIASATGGRDGRVRTDDGRVDHALTMPKSIGGQGGDGTNPEQLFAAGYSACFSSALKLVAMRKRVDPGAFVITAHVTLGKGEQGFGLATELHGSFPTLARDEAQALMEAAHHVCPYSVATRGNMPVTIVVD